MPRSSGKVVGVDLDSWLTLVRFAAVTRVDRSGLTRAKLAKRMDMQDGNLHTALYGRPDNETITRPFLQKLDWALRMVSDPASPAHARWARTSLSGLREELYDAPEPERERERERERNPEAPVLGAWFEDLCGGGPARSAAEALLRGEALHDLLRHRDRPGGVHAHRLEAVERQAVADLLSVAGLPPSTGMAAIRVLARIGLDALPEIEQEIYQSPVGFRSLRPLSRMLHGLERRGAAGRGRSAADAALLGELETLLQRIVRQEPADPCLGRGYFVEALRAAPGHQPGGAWDWVDDELDSIARRGDRPVRERMFALGVAAERSTAADPTGLLRHARDEANRTGEEGLAWTLALIEHRRAGCPGGLWPDRPEPALVAEVSARIADTSSDELPPVSVEGAKYLITEALLTFDETRRRKACDVLNVAHLSDTLAPALADVVTARGRAPRWLREHTAYVLGYLDGHDALDSLREVITDPTEDPTVLHAAAWGLGDSCGAGRAGAHDRCLPVDSLVALLAHPDAPPRQAAAYTLAIVHPRRVRPVLTRVVDEMDTDPTTRGLARWGQWLQDADAGLGRPDATIGVPGSRTLVFGSRS